MKPVARPDLKSFPFGAAKLAALLFVAGGAAATYFFFAAPRAQKRSQVPASRPMSRTPESVFAGARPQTKAARARTVGPVVVWFDSVEARERLLEGAD